MSFKYAFVCLMTLLAACGTLPRGAGLQTEILAKGDDGSRQASDSAEPAGFAIEAITRDSLKRFVSWPAVGENALPWIKRVDQPNSRILAPGDTVSLTIWSTEDNGLLNTNGQRVVNLPPTPLSSSGQLFLPYIGQIKLSGMSPDHARAEVEKAYTRVISSAQVQLAVTEGRQSTASLVAGVANPGSFPLVDRDVTILDLLAQGGGVAARLVNPQIRLQRGNRTYGTSMTRLLADTEMNTTLVGGDRVFIEEDSRYFLSLGASGSKAQHRFPQDSVSALDAISIIGGLSADRANAKGVLILRSYPASSLRRDGSGPRNSRTIFTLDLTTADGLFSAGAFQIRPGDLIYVTESPLIGTRNVFGIIGSVFGLANSAGNL